jgi:hypothetical protein
MVLGHIVTTSRSVSDCSLYHGQFQTAHYITASFRLLTISRPVSDWSLYHGQFQTGTDRDIVTMFPSTITSRME